MPRHIVLASGLRDGIYHQYAQRYKEILAREGVTVAERMTGGAEENERLLRDPKSGVDVAFMHGGVVRPSDREKLTMLATLYYEPLWIFYRDSVVHPHFDAAGLSPIWMRAAAARVDAGATRARRRTSPTIDVSTQRHSCRCAQRSRTCWH